jgi:hypothetical protein
MSTLSPTAAVLVIIVTAVLIGINVKRDARALLQKQFAATFDPGGPYTECKIRFPLAEVSTPCMARVTAEGLYLFTSAELRATWSWMNNVPFLNKAVFIPWASLAYSPAKFPMRKWIRFDVTSTKAMFFMPREVALNLLRAAGRSVPLAS